MATLKDIQRQIVAVKKTQQITKAMNMVAASKLKGAQTKMERFRPYSAKFKEVLGSLAGRTSAEASPLLEEREKIKKIELVLFTSDRGLCGSFNINLITMAEKFINEKKSQGIEVKLTCIGKKGYEYFKRRMPQVIRKYYTEFLNSFDISDASTLGNELTDLFLTEEVDNVSLLFAEFISVGRQVPVVQQLLPVPSLEEADDTVVTEYLCEPDANSLLGDILPRYINVICYSAMLEVSASEHAARMSAMDNATRNCKEMSETLTLQFNKARQAAITAELMDIIGGAEALRG